MAEAAPVAAVTGEEVHAGYAADAVHHRVVLALRGLGVDVDRDRGGGLAEPVDETGKLLRPLVRGDDVRDPHGRGLRARQYAPRPVSRTQNVLPRIRKSSLSDHPWT